MSYDNRGQVSLWKNQSENEKAPILKGTFIAHRDIREGEEVEIALWRNDSDNPKAPRLKGKGSDRQQAPTPPPGVPQGYEGVSPTDDDFDDDIPF